MGPQQEQGLTKYTRSEASLHAVRSSSLSTEKDWLELSSTIVLRPRLQAWLKSLAACAAVESFLRSDGDVCPAAAIVPGDDGRVQDLNNGNPAP